MAEDNPIRRLAQQAAAGIFSMDPAEVDELVGHVRTMRQVLLDEAKFVGELDKVGGLGEGYPPSDVLVPKLQRKVDGPDNSVQAGWQDHADALGELEAALLQCKANFERVEQDNQQRFNGLGL
ncbi:MAG: hypothetical protein ACRCSF_08125 [Mycobacteriaceae bacterium]